MKDTIAFISTYAHPARDNAERALRAAFPEYRVENFSLHDLVRTHKEWIAPNLWSLVREYGRDVLMRRTTLRSRYFQTTYLFRKIRLMMREVIDPQRHVFSFQTHSMYDCSVPGVPHFVYTDHTHLSNLAVPHFNRSSLRPPGWLALERTIYRNATAVFTFSNDVAFDLLRHYRIALTKVMCAYAGSNIKASADVVRETESYAGRQILFVGSDWDRKGGPDLVEAFRKVLKVYPDAQLVVAGASPKIDLPNCNILGPVPISQLAEHYARASVFCMPTRLEPFGIAFLEAMMHRLPVVATQIGAIPEIVQDGLTGELVVPGDTDALASALLGFLGNPARCQRAGEAGYRRATQIYTWEHVAERMRARILPMIGVVDRRGKADPPPAPHRRRAAVS